MTRIILFGAPGSGKGTQSRRIETRMGYPQISTGDLIRAEIAAQTPLGLKVRPILESGQYIDDAIIVEMVRDRIQRDDVVDGYVMDGFPRTLSQAIALSEIPADREVTIHLEIDSVETLIQRILSRITCVKCGAVYNLKDHLPAVEGKCDVCASPLKRRVDDSEAAIRERFKIYEAQTLPMLDYYRNKGTLHRVDATMDADRIAMDIERILK